MHEAWLEIARTNDAIGAGLALIFLATFYIIAKTTIWWLLFGTGRLLFGKYTIAEWGIRTLVGLVGFAVLILFNSSLIWLFDEESNVYLGFWGISLFFSLRIWIREIFSLLGLLRGDWNPFHPHLRFFAWKETYIFSLFGNPPQPKGCWFPLPFPEYSEEQRRLEDAMYYQQQCERQNRNLK